MPLAFWILAGVYVLSIGGLLFGPRYLLHRHAMWRGEDPPWFLGSAVYAPLAGLILLWLIPLVAPELGLAPLVTAETLGNVIRDKFGIIFLILSFGYLAVSLDASGFFAYCAYAIVRRARGDGTQLFVNLYLLCSVLSLFTSNDIVILAMTPIVLHIGRQTKVTNLVPLLISLFVAANTFSMGLYIGSPANIVLADAAGITFVDFFAWMFAPALAACGVTLVMLLLVFRWMPLRGNRMADRFEVPPVSDAVKPSAGMKRKLVVFALCLAALTAGSFLPFNLWKICLAAAVGMALIDIMVIRRAGGSLRAYARRVAGHLPWAIAPFVICFFVMVEGLQRTGFLDAATKLLSGFATGSLLKTALVFGYVSSLLVNVLNDIPSAVFWARMLPALQASMDSQSYQVVLYSLLVGLHTGTYLTVIGALAGLMWMNVMRTLGDSTQKTPTAGDLTFYGLIVFVPVVAAACATVVLEVVLFG